jgi:large subunit ribosomal protein L21
MYAIVRTGGKQHRVEAGRAVVVERLPAEEGATVQLDDVLLIADDGQVTIGTPTIEGARVLAEVEAHGRAKKIIVFKYKAKVRSRKKTGHRQSFTRLVVREILRPGEEPQKETKPRRRAKAEEAEAAEEAIEAPVTEAVEVPVTEAVEVPVTEAVEVPVAEPEAAPKRRTRRAAEPEAKAEEPKPRARRKAPEPKAEEKPARRRTPRPKKETE